MMPSDPKFDDYLFELRDLMRAKGDVITINSLLNPFTFIILNIVMITTLTKLLFLMTRISHLMMTMWNMATMMKMSYSTSSMRRS